MKWQRIATYCFVFIAGTACTQLCTKMHSDFTPEEVVEAYLDTAFGMTDISERHRLAAFTTGALRDAIQSSSDEVIKKAYIDRQRKIVSYSVVERQDRTPKEVEITFQIAFKELGTNSNKITEKNAATVTTENTLSVVKQHSKWMIAEVLGKRTTIDFPVTEDSVIKAKPGPGIDEETVDVIEQVEENTRTEEDTPEVESPDDSTTEEPQ